MTRTITGTILKPDGSAHYEASVVFDLQTVLATTSTESVIQQQVTATTDENGAYSAALAVPESGSWRWRVRLPDGNSAMFWLADGDATTLEAILLAASLEGEPGAADALIALIGAHNATTTAVHGITDTADLLTDAPSDGSQYARQDGDWAAVAAGGASDIDNLTTTTGTDGQYVNVAAAGGLQYRSTAQVLSDIGAEAAGAAATVAGNLTSHTDATTSVHGITDTSALALTGDAPAAHAASHATAGDDAIAAADIGAATSGHDHSGTYEPVLGNPGTDGHILSSTIAGVRSWIEAAAGGVALNVANTWTALQTFSAGIVGGWVAPAADSTTAFEIRKADKTTPVVTVNTTNSRVGINSTPGSSDILKLAHTDGLSVVRFTRVGGTNFFSMGQTTSWKTEAGGMTFDTDGTNGQDLTFKAKGVSAMKIYRTGAVTIGSIDTGTAHLMLAAGTTSRASLRIQSGVAPTSPNDGDMWQDGTNLLVRINGTTYTLDKTAV